MLAFEVADALASIVVPTLEAKKNNRLILAKQVEHVCELHFSACVGAGLDDRRPDDGFQQVMTQDA